MLFRYRFRQRRDGMVEVRISDDERRLIGDLMEQLRELLLSTSPVGHLDPSLRRLYPAAYVEEVDYELEYQQSKRDHLLERRLSHLDVVDATLSNVELDSDSVTAWITTINDLRLVLGTQLDVSEDDAPGNFDPEDARQRHQAIYHYLSHLLGELVDAAGI